MAIVCRPLIIYNEFLPAEIKGEREWEYQAFGHHDGIKIGDSVVFDCAQQLDVLFDKSVEYEIEEGQSYFTQVFWGIHESEIEEAAFWKDKDEFPFLYIVLLQIDERNIKEHNFKVELCKKLNQKLGEMQCEEKKASLLFYHSLDNSDLIMVVKSNSADLGFKLINILYHNIEELCVTIRNTYTILGVSRRELDKNDLNNIPEKEKITLLELQIIERERDKVNLLYKKLKEDIKADEIDMKITLGTEDDVIFIKNVFWKDLLPSYKKDTGVLCNSNKIMQKYAYAISSKVMMQEEIDNGDTNKESNSNIDVKSSFCDKLDKMIRKLPSDLYVEKKNLLILVNALRRFEYGLNQERPFTDYNFFPLFLPFYRFIELAKDEDKYILTEYYYHFMKCMKLCTQNFSKPERIYSQITDFNMRYFDIPMKLITLYNAYIYSIKQVLILDPKRSYEFLICAGLNDNTEVKELFFQVSDTKRLFLIETSEQQMYHIKLMFFILGHEMAHFVGREIRNRKRRQKHIFKICSRIISLSIRSYYEYREDLENSCLDSYEWGKTEKDLEKCIKFYIERSQNEDYIKKFQFYNAKLSEKFIQTHIKDSVKYGLHTDILQIDLLDAIKDMLVNRGQEIFSFIIRERYVEQSNEGKSWELFSQEQREDLEKCINSFLGISVNPRTSLTASMAIEGTLFWMKECYADIISILLLKISLKDYIGYFVTMLNPQKGDMDNFKKKDLVIRIAIVMSVMSYPLKNDVEEKNCFHWTDEEYNNEKEWSEEVRILEQVASDFSCAYIANKKVFQKGELIKNPREIFCDQIVLKEIVQYLVYCRQYFYDNIENLQKKKLSEKAQCLKKENLERVRRFYHMSNMEDANSFFDEMMSLLAWYENDVYHEISQLI